ncbi:MAG: long-chain fatty acid--CoA ligase [Verrucomicrobia bacterium]|nr:long-chain fatty acid--CoA ligase [Verrucomicrobiota bacterium]
MQEPLKTDPVGLDAVAPSPAGVLAPEVFPEHLMQTPRRVFDLLNFQADHCPQTAAFAQKVGGEWRKFSTAESLDTIASLAWGLHLEGVRQGDHIANVTETNRAEWCFIDCAVMCLGAVHLPIYPDISSEEFEFILSDAGATLIFVSSDRLYRQIALLQAKLPALRDIYTYDPVIGAKQWTQLQAAGREGLSNQDNQSMLERIKAKVDPGDLATLIYTSGTTGTPKGVMLSHLNLITSCLVCAALIRRTSPERALSFLPLCHIYERTLINVCVYLGISVFFAQNLTTVGEDLRETQPNVFAAVPRILEKIYEKFVLKGSQLNGAQRAIYFWALRLAREFAPDEPISPLRRLKLAVADRLIYGRWREALGGRIHAIISGSAALQPALARVFWAARMPVYEGYGPTEASPVISVNCPIKGRYKIGTVGPVISCGEAKIAADGEILYRGPNVMLGYYHQPEQTAEAIDSEGWLHTGDVGEFDGIFLKITDRKKAIFKTSGGKSVAPQQIENRMKESKFIAQIMVVGENQKFPAALIVPAFQTVTDHFKQRGTTLHSNREVAAHPEVKTLIESEIRRLNEHFGHYAQIKKFVLLHEEWSLEGGELTPTLKLKRRELLKKYAGEIESIYAGEEENAADSNIRPEDPLPNVTERL